MCGAHIIKLGGCCLLHLFYLFLNMLVLIVFLSESFQISVESLPWFISRYRSRVLFNHCYSFLKGWRSFLFLGYITSNRCLSLLWWPLGSSCKLWGLLSRCGHVRLICDGWIDTITIDCCTCCCCSLSYCRTYPSHIWFLLLSLSLLLWTISVWGISPNSTVTSFKKCLCVLLSLLLLFSLFGELSLVWC